MSELAALRDTDEKYRRGDSLTDEEVAALAKAYRTASLALDKIFHRSYDLVSIDLHRRASELEGFQQARREHRRENRR